MTTTITTRHHRMGAVRLRDQRWCSRSEGNHCCIDFSYSSSSSSCSSSSSTIMQSSSLVKRRTLSQQQNQQPKQHHLQQHPPPTMRRMLSSSFAIMVVSMIFSLLTATAAAQETVLVFNDVTVTINTGLPAAPPPPREDTVTATEVSAAVGSGTSPLSTVTSSSRHYPRQAVDGNGQAEPKRRVRVSPFLISLVKTPAPLQPYEYDELYSIIQQLLNDHIGEMTHQVALKDLEQQQQQQENSSAVSAMTATTAASTSTASATTQLSADTSDEYLSLTYVLLTDIDGVFTGEPESTTTLTMGEGVAAFYAPGGPAAVQSVPSEELVDDWVRQAIDTELVNKLATTKYGYVQQATYVSLDQHDGNGNNTDSGGGSGDDVSEVVSPREAQAQAAARPAMTVGLVAAVACAGALTLVVVAFLVGKSRQNKNNAARLQYASSGGGSSRENDPALMLDGTSRNSPKKVIPPGRTYKLDDDDDDDDDDDMDEEEQTNTCLKRAKNNISPVTAATMAVARATSELECRSMAEMSDSDFTVSTEAGDSAALKSIGGGGGTSGGYGGGGGGAGSSYFARFGGGGGRDMTVPPMVTAESFEHDRQVSLRKDMLTSPWSGRMPSIRTSQQESVLQPSHFTASQERRLRQTINNIDFDQESGRGGGWNTRSSSLGGAGGGGGVGDNDDVLGGLSGSGSGEAPFIFRPHTEEVGEEIFIMRGSGGQRETELL
jgi:hypothetical protein